MDWIKTALQDPGAERYMGWDRKKKKHNPSRRVCVGIALKKKGGADFITAYVSDMKNTGHDQKKSARFGNKKTADSPGRLSGGLFRFCCH